MSLLHPLLIAPPLNTLSALFYLPPPSLPPIGTSGAIPVSLYFGVVLVWFVVSIPLTFVGGYLVSHLLHACSLTEERQGSEGQGSAR
jgi:hypothetical protein